MKKYLYPLIFCLLLTFFLIPDGWCISVIDRRMVTFRNVRSIIFSSGLCLILVLSILALCKKISWRWILFILNSLTTVAITGQIMDCMGYLDGQIAGAGYLFGLFAFICAVCGIWCLFPASKKHLKKIFLIWLAVIIISIVSANTNGPLDLCRVNEINSSMIFLSK